MNLAIVDLAYGNIGSIKLAFERFGVTPIVTADPELIAKADRVVMPGVGAAGHAMQRIDKLGLRECLRSLTKPGLGICLGMQLLFERSEEADNGGTLPCDHHTGAGCTNPPPGAFYPWYHLLRPPTGAT